MSKHNIGLVQINNSFSGASYFPYSVAILQSYAVSVLTSPENFNFLIPIFERVKIKDAVKELINSDIVFFSLYVWNAQLSLAIIKELKKVKPELLIICGGPHVPDKSEEFLRKNPYISAVVRGAGEVPFHSILENIVDQKATDWKNIPSLSYIDSNHIFNENPLAPKLKDISLIPSPYLAGVFDELMSKYPERDWLAAWETNRGCPFSCTYCDWGSATESKITSFELERLYKEIDWFKDRKIEFIFCCDANFGILKRDVDIATYVSNSKEKFGYPKALSVQNTKNATERAYLVQKILSESGLNKGVTLAVQSMDAETLKNVRRDNIKLSSYEILQYRFMREGIETYSDMILGMPGETFKSFYGGICTLIENGQHNRIQFGNLTILPNAEMGNKEYRTKHGMQIVESKMINIHGSLNENEEIDEIQETVIATNSMPREDWINTRSLCWLVSFLHFNKVLQIPFIILNTVAGLKYNDIFEEFLNWEDDQLCPIFTEIKNNFKKRAIIIQQGGPDYVASVEYLNIWWPDDELALIKICNEGQLSAFYKEAEIIFKSLITKKNLSLPRGLLEETLSLNENMMKLPFQTTNEIIEVNYNIYEIYKNALIGKETTIIEAPRTYTINKTLKKWDSWDIWCKEVIWYGNKKGDYIYKIDNINPHLCVDDQPGINQVVGHF